MVSYATSFFNYLFSRDDNEIDDDDDDTFESKLAELQIEDAIKNNETISHSEDLVSEIPDDKSCFRKTGIISYIDEKNNYILIDGTYYFDTSSCSHELRLNDKVLYLGYYKQDNQPVIVRILQNEGNFWGDEDSEVKEEVHFQQNDHTLVGQVAGREGRMVYMANGDIKFNLDDVDGMFVPLEGDILEMCCKVVSTEDSGIENGKKVAAVSSAEVLEVFAFKPLGLKIMPGTVTDWNGTYGTCDKKIYFTEHSLPSGIVPKAGDKVLMKVIESYQDKCIYRAIQLQLTSESHQNDETVVDNDEESSFQLENDEKLEITYPLSFMVDMHQTARIHLKVINKGEQTQIINKWIILSKKRDSQININPTITQPYRLFPGQTVTFIVTCQPRFLGKAKEHVVFLFKGFKIKRVIAINVISKETAIDKNASTGNKKWSTYDKFAKMKEIRNNGCNIIQGRKFNRSPNFTAVRIGNFFVPNILWNLMLGDSDKTEIITEKSEIFRKLDDKYPFLKQELNVHNYVNKWHTLLYLEEIHETIHMRFYDIEKTYLVRHHEYLSLEVKGLAEKRPSLIVGDKVVVKDIYDEKAPKYESVIQEIKGNCVLMKFHHAFQENYTGSDVSVEFFFNRNSYRKCHHAISTALVKLGPEILFPSRLTISKSQIPLENLKSIQLYNDSLNECQKAAVTNILQGQCRPKPYCIYGPPGTGKTVTVVETILQILANIPYSRVLVAAPSNSAANLITERLIDYKENNLFSLVRVVAYSYYKADNIPPKIKPYCVTVDIAQEGSAQSKHVVHDTVNLNCQSSFLGRHRVTIGTCGALGSLVYMGFPKDHFTHVIVDEAGQATEPEIMIPLTLIDKENGQIILAGDPKQLGPIVGSPFAHDYGLDESYMMRILETTPYQRDTTAFQNGFNEKLVTKLNDNYRSLKEVLSLPSQMFYHGSLVERFDRNQEWVKHLIDVCSEIFETGDSRSGGIYVHGIRGCNTRSEDSPSWYNPQEATMVALTASKIYRRRVSPDDIGIITPYVAQIKYLRNLFEGMGLPQPKIGTVEEFQGQEKPLILISTVRSSETLLSEDVKHTLGFVKNAKRLNVSLTRAQVAVLLFCDPHLLSTDPLWSRVLSQAIKEEKYMGCDLPKKLIL